LEKSKKGFRIPVDNEEKEAYYNTINGNVSELMKLEK
jgi:hypothetical protein